jgi:hypothetical protein
MERKHDLRKHDEILKTLIKLPRKIVSVYGHANVPELVLHDFCHECCFNFAKVAYFVDNPDFNCFKGIAGLTQEERQRCAQIADVWQSPEQFQSIMDTSSFNSKVRSIEVCSILQKGKESAKDVIQQLGKELSFDDPDFFTWRSKHENNGYLIFERPSCHDTVIHEHLIDGAYLLSFCPIA